MSSENAYVQERRSALWCLVQCTAKWAIEVAVALCGQFILRRSSDSPMRTAVCVKCERASTQTRTTRSGRYLRLYMLWEGILQGQLK